MDGEHASSYTSSRKARYIESSLLTEETKEAKYEFTHEELIRICSSSIELDKFLQLPRVFRGEDGMWAPPDEDDADYIESCLRDVKMLPLQTLKDLIGSGYFENLEKYLEYRESLSSDSGSDSSE